MSTLTLRPKAAQSCATIDMADLLTLTGLVDDPDKWDAATETGFMRELNVTIFAMVTDAEGNGTLAINNAEPEYHDILVQYGDSGGNNEPIIEIENIKNAEHATRLADALATMFGVDVIAEESID